MNDLLQESTGFIRERINGYKAVFINKPIYIGDYLEDGLTKKDYLCDWKIPWAGMENSKEFLTKRCVFKS